MNKNLLRKKYLELRKNCKSNSSAICKKLFSLPEFINAKTVFTYVSFGFEINTFNIIKKCLELGKKVAVPKCINSNIEFYYINSLKDLILGQYNILEPTTSYKALDFNNSICITPGVVFDKRGYRIGYGKGFYDRFFQKYTGFKIGLCSKECCIEKIENDNFDIPVDIVIHN